MNWTGRCPLFSTTANNQQKWLLFFWVQDAQRTESTLDSSGVWRLFFVLELNGLVEMLGMILDN